MSKSVLFEIYTKEKVKEINEKIKQQLAGVDTVDFIKEPETERAQDAVKTGKFFTIPCMPLMNLLSPWLCQCQKINREQFGYDVYWDFHIESLNYNVYGENGEYTWHIDSNSSSDNGVLYDSKLTCLLNLSEEPYEGGEFLTTNEAGKTKFDSGMGLIVNSLVAHRVTPVTKGERITLTYFATGPRWK